MLLEVINMGFLEDLFGNLLETEKPIAALGNSTLRIRLKTDPRAKVRELAGKVNWYTLNDKNTVPHSIIQE